MHGKDTPEETGIFWQLEDILPSACFIRSQFTFGSFFKRPIESDELSPWPDVDVDMFVSMYRAKETLSIQGFYANFAAALRGLIKWLSVRDVFSLVNHRIIWQICRSPALRVALEEIIKLKLVPRVRSEIEAEEDRYKERLAELNSKIIIDTSSHLFAADVYLWAGLGFFLLLNGQGNDLNYAAKEMALNLVARQRDNGSFNDDVITTCLAASCIHLAGIQGTGIATTEKAVEWLLQQQKKGGSWSSVDSNSNEDHFVDVTDWIPGYSRKLVADHAQTTVIVLETIDLIINSRPLPIWSYREETSVSKVGRDPRLQAIVPFPTPVGATWDQVRIRFLSHQAAELSVRDVREGRDFREMGFRDKRKDAPDKLWALLKLLGLNRGEIEIMGKNLPLKHKLLKAQIKDLRKRLIHLFQINEDPFEDYRRVKAYTTRFIIEACAEEDEDKEEVFKEELIDREEEDSTEEES